MTKLNGSKMRCALFVAVAATAMTASAQTLTTLTAFNGGDGELPYAGLIQGADGEFYGTTRSGGANNYGTAFKITPGGTLTTLYSFCSEGQCADGGSPNALVLDDDGNLYGTTDGGGANTFGTVFRITPGGTLTTLYSFCPEHPCPDGAIPEAGLIEAVNGDLYGTTYEGGANDYGTVFKITPGGTLKTVHSFNCNDGAYPKAALIQATDGNFYGTTSATGGDCDDKAGGTVFKITPTGTLTTLFIFQQCCADGSGPLAPLIQATDGSLYGTTSGGGANNAGTVYEITRDGTLATLYNFCEQNSCSDGEAPEGALVQATDGNFYGTTAYGGSDTAGTIFKMAPNGALTTLYSFCPENPCSDGLRPWAGPLQGTNGEFYGTTVFGGGNSSCNNGCGTVFSLDVGLGPFVTFVRAAGRVGQTGGILGQGFTGTTAVSLNGIPASFTVKSDTFIEATVPPGATTGYVTVTTPSGTLTSNVPFHVIP